MGELKKIEIDVKAGKKSIEDFEDLVELYTIDDEKKFNTFLRKRNFRNVSPKDYAEMCKKIKIMRDGLIDGSEALNKTRVTLYRYTSLSGIVDMLSGSGIVPRGWLRQQKKKFEEKCKREDENIQEDEAKKKETDKEKKERRTKEYNKMLADKIMALFSKNPIVSDRGFLSTSKSKTATRCFGDNKLIIDCAVGSIRCMDISDLSRAPYEEEVLFVPDQKFKVDFSKTKDITETKGGYKSDPCFEITLKTI